MDTRKILAELRSERDRIGHAILAIEAISGEGTRLTRAVRAARTPSKPRRRYRMTAAARKKLSAMMKARWAERKKKKNKAA